MSEIVGLVSQFATQNSLEYYSKLNLSSKFHAEVATQLPHLKLKNYRPIPRILYHYNCYFIAIICYPIHDLSNYFYAKIGTQ